MPRRETSALLHDGWLLRGENQLNARSGLEKEKNPNEKHFRPGNTRNNSNSARDRTGPRTIGRAYSVKELRKKKKKKNANSRGGGAALMKES